MDSSNSDIVVFMSHGKTKCKIIGNSSADGNDHSAFSSAHGNDHSAFRFNPKKKDCLDSIQIKRLKTENALLLEKIQILDQEVSSLKEDLGVRRKMEDISSYSTDITACSNCGCTRCHMTTDIYKLVEQANKNSLDNRIRLSVVEFENTKTVNANEKLQQNGKNRQENDQQYELKQNQEQLKNVKDVDHLYLKLQEELVACKLREAESCLGFKELQTKVRKMEKHWEQFVRDIENSKQSCQPNWKKHLELKESLLSLKVKEVSMVSDFNELKQKLIELETENNVYKRQERKLKEVVSKMEEKISRVEMDKDELGNKLKENDRRTDVLHTQFKEQVLMHKIKEAEQCQAVAVLRRSKAEFEIENQQLMTTLKLSNPSNSQTSKEYKKYNNCNSYSENAYRTTTKLDEDSRKDCQSVNPENVSQEGDDVLELLSKCDMSDIMTESFYADSVFLHNNIQALTNYDSLVTSDSNHTIHEDNSETDSLN